MFLWLCYVLMSGGMSSSIVISNVFVIVMIMLFDD